MPFRFTREPLDPERVCRVLAGVMLLACSNVVWDDDERKVGFDDCMLTIENLEFLQRLGFAGSRLFNLGAFERLRSEVLRVEGFLKAALKYPGRNFVGLSFQNKIYEIFASEPSWPGSSYQVPLVTPEYFEKYLEEYLAKVMPGNVLIEGVTVGVFLGIYTEKDTDREEESVTSAAVGESGARAAEVAVSASSGGGGRFRRFWKSFQKSRAASRARDRAIRADQQRINVGMSLGVHAFS